MPKGQKPKEKVKVEKAVVDIMPPGTPKGFIPAGRAGRTSQAGQLSSFTAKDPEKQKQSEQEIAAKKERDEVRKQQIAAEKKIELQRMLSRLMRESGMVAQC